MKHFGRLKTISRRRTPWAAASALLGAWAMAAVFGAAAAPALAEEGLRRIEAPRFGVVVTAPGAWRLMEWSENDRAFVLHLPQEKSSADGYVRCELASAPENLTDFQKVDRDQNEREQHSGDPRRKLVSDTIEGGDGPPDRQRLATVWELLDANVEPGEERRFEVTLRLVRQETLYTFTLITDEAHFAAYRAEFDDLVASARLSPPEAGLTAVADGYWLQPQFQFGLRPPQGWKPSFGASDRALWFAHGAAHGVFVDHVSVSASARAPLDLPTLQAGAGAAAAKAKPAARMVDCRIVALGATNGLETVLESERGDVPVTIVERRFAARGETTRFASCARPRHSSSRRPRFANRSTAFANCQKPPRRRSSNDRDLRP